MIVNTFIPSVNKNFSGDQIYFTFKTLIYDSYSVDSYFQCWNDCL